MERMCKEDPDWQREKLRLLPIIALLEESISENISENLQQKNLKLPDDKRMEILASIGKEEESRDASSSDGNDSESTTFDKDKINDLATLGKRRLSFLQSHSGDIQKKNQFLKKPLRWPKAQNSL